MTRPPLATLVARARIGLAALALAFAWLPWPAAAQAPAEPARALASVSVGFVRPSAGLVRDLYGRQLPVAVQVDWRIGRRLAVFGGGRFQRASGMTRIVDPVFDESYPLSLRTTCLRAGVLVLVSRWQWEFAIGGGPSYVWYDERWPDAGVTAKGSRAGVLLQAGAARAIRGPLAAVARLEYDSVSVRRGDAGEGRVNLGGLAVGAGLGLRF